MGMAKKEMMRHQELVEQATRVALRAKALKTCLVHDDVVMDAEDPDAARAAYAIGTNMVKAGEVNSTRQEFMSAIKEAIEGAAMDCGRCAKNAED